MVQTIQNCTGFYDAKVLLHKYIPSLNPYCDDINA